MGSTIQEKMKKLSHARQKKIQKRADELIIEELTLRDLRKALNMTQVELGEKLHMKQESISRLERNTDILLSTLVRFIQAMGGDLKLTAEFPDRPPVNIQGFCDIQQQSQK